MNIFDTPIGKDTLRVLKRTGSAATGVHLKMEWVVPGMENIEVKRVHHQHTMRDYNDGTYDMITAIVEVRVEDYMKYLYPKRAALAMDVYRTPASEKGVYINNKAIFNTYKALLLTNEDPELFDQTYAGNNAKEKDNNVMNVAVQLIEKEIYLHKDASYSGVLGPGNFEDYLYYFMSNRGRLMCSIHPIDNKDSPENIVIPEGIDLLNLANWLQRYGPGIYNHGINTYFQKGRMWVYPTALLETHEYRQKIAIFRVGNDVGIGTGNTYCVVDGKLQIISAGTVALPEGEERLVDDREELEQTHGNVIAWNDPRYQSTSIDETDDQMRYTSRGSHVYGLSDVDIKIRKVHKQHTVNGYSQRSIINKTLGRVLTIPWQSGDIYELEPGMEVQYHYMKGKEAECINGVLEGCIEELAVQEGRQEGNIMGVLVSLRIRVP